MLFSKGSLNCIKFKNLIMKKSIFILLILFSSVIYAQNEIDAFRFSQFYPEGTARSMSMGNAFGALGADVSTAVTNPAGIGLFKHSELVLSPSVMMSNTTANFNDTKTNSDHLSMMFSNASYVLGFRNSGSDLKALNFAMGYNRYNNFKHNYNIQGVNNKGSMLDYFMLSANGTSPENLNDFTTFRAWDTWLIDQVDSGSLYYTNPLWNVTGPDDVPQYGQTQTRIIQVKGGAGEYFINGAFNYKDVFFFGATVAFQNFNYSYNLQHTESGFVDSTDLNSFTYNEYLNDEGSGVNFKAGIIIKPVDFIRVGATFNSPSYMTIDDRFYTSISSHWSTPDNNGNYDYESSSAQNDYTYHLTTPMRLSGNLGIVISKYAVIGFDYEYVDYSSMRLSASDYMFTAENENIRQDFKSTYNLRGGAELNFGMIKLRGGYAYFGNPYKNQNFEKSQITAGIGISTKNVFVDFAYIMDLRKNDYYMYNGYTDEPIPKLTTNSNIVNVTFGIKF